MSDKNSPDSEKKTKSRKKNKKRKKSANSPNCDNDQPEKKHLTMTSPPPNMYPGYPGYNMGLPAPGIPGTPDQNGQHVAPHLQYMNTTTSVPATSQAPGATYVQPPSSVTSPGPPSTLSQEPPWV